MRRTALLAVVGLVGVLAVATSSTASMAPGRAPTSAAPAPAGRPGAAVHLALGDSVAAGVGATPDAGNGYVPVLFRTLTAASCGRDEGPRCRLDLVNLAEGGATTATLLAEQLPAALELIAARRATRSPVDDVRLVTVTIGGNDVFTPVVTACSADPGSATCRSTISGQLRQVDADYDRMLAALRAAAGPRTVVAVMAYHNPLASCDLAGLAPLADLVLEGGGPLPAGLNDVIRARAGQYGATVVETAPVIGAEDLVGGTDCLHPDTSGHADIAAAFAGAVDVRAVACPAGR